MDNERQPAPDTGKKHRSPNYPAIGLGEAVKLARALWERERKTAVAPEVAVKSWGYSALSGHARIKLAAVKKFQLISDEGRGVRVSDLALEILPFPDGSSEQLPALRRAALAPELFQELAVNFLHGSDDAIRRELTYRRSFLDDGASSAIKAFRETVQVAKLDAPDYILEHATEPSPEPRPAPTNPSSARSPRHASKAATAMTSTHQPPAAPSTPPQPQAATTGVKVFSWPLSKGVTAEVRFTGSEVGPEHLERLRKYLELAKDAMADEEESPPTA
jgi:hypothetical protein